MTKSKNYKNEKGTWPIPASNDDKCLYNGQNIFFFWWLFLSLLSVWGSPWLQFSWASAALALVDKFLVKMLFAEQFLLLLYLWCMLWLVLYLFWLRNSSLYMFEFLVTPIVPFGYANIDSPTRSPGVWFWKNDRFFGLLLSLECNILAFAPAAVRR